MKDIKSISGISHHYPLGMHIDMQLQVYGLVQPIAHEKILLDASDIPAWKEDIDKEKESVREPAAYAETKHLKEKDKKRDEIITSLFQEIRTASKSLVANRQEAGHRLNLVVDAYKGLQNESLSNKTGHVVGLLNDLDKPAATADLTTLGLAAVVPMLKNINDEFIALRSARLKAEAADTQKPGTDLRSKNDTTATKIFRHIEAAYLSATSEDDRKLIGELIDRINRVLSHTKTQYSQSLALKRLAAGKKEKPNKPSKPKPPKKDDTPDIHLPEEDDPKTPETPKTPEGGSGSGGKTPEGSESASGSSSSTPEIHMPEE